MTDGGLSVREIDGPAAAYEKLRSQVLAGSPRSGQFGLGLLLRLAYWPALRWQAVRG